MSFLNSDRPFHRFFLAIRGFFTMAFSVPAAKKLSQVDIRLQELGLVLAQSPPSIANYLPYVISGKWIFIAGQLPYHQGKLHVKGKVGGAVSIQEAQQGAKYAALNIVAQLKAAIGDLDKVKRCVKLSGFVNAIPEFTEHPQVINGASDLIVDIFGEKGKHARMAIGVTSLPAQASVEVDAIFELE